MSRRPRGLSAEEAALWAKVAGTVTPMDGQRPITPPLVAKLAAQRADQGASPQARKPSVPTPPQRTPASRSGNDVQRQTLDSNWDRKLSRGLAQPDFTLDLHGSTLDAAHGRLLQGMTQARAMGARLVLLITGKPRPVEMADRGTRRGAIRAKVIDWLAASDHAHDIAAIRGAHRRHGGQGALYIVLKRRR